jgi:hypothetical protein
MMYSGKESRGEIGRDITVEIQRIFYGAEWIYEIFASRVLISCLPICRLSQMRPSSHMPIFETPQNRRLNLSHPMDSPILIIIHSTTSIILAVQEVLKDQPKVIQSG